MRSSDVDGGLTGRVALVSGANHGIGAATARALAARGAAVLVTYLRFEEPADPGTPEAYGRDRAGDGSGVSDAIRAAGGRATSVEADLADPASASALFDAAERAFGPVEILVNNASGWLADTFKPAEVDRLGRRLQPVSAETFDRQFAVDARATALLIAEFARRHVARGGPGAGSSVSPRAARWVSSRRSPTARPRPPWRTTRCPPLLSSPSTASPPTSSTRR